MKAKIWQRRGCTMKRSLGKLSKRTRLLRKRSRTELTVSGRLKSFKLGDSVHLTPRGGKSMPHPRYRGRTGRVVGMRGSAYEVEITDMNAVKRLIIDGVHLTKVRV
ncbi:50S ribosomal protein L21e [Candidatus Micrarchaeota archaeon]|nr:MAG: 50S ribosomal protein L21e [Candidatus Micrarchaeota archaeon]